MRRTRGGTTAVRNFLRAMPQPLPPSNPSLPKMSLPPEKKKTAIRTMKSDAEDLFKTTKPSLLQMLNREATAETAVPNRKIGNKKKSRLGYYYIGGVLIGVLLVGSGAFLLLKSSDREQIKPALISPPPFFSTESSRTISVKNRDRTVFLRLMEDAMRERERTGTIKRLNIKLEDRGKERFASLADFLDFYRIEPPPDFLNRIGDPFMPFIYQSGEGPRFGFAVRMRDRERTLRNLLTWEPFLLRDFGPLFFRESPDVVIAPFEDRTSHNIDWRYLKLSQDKDLGIGHSIFQNGGILVMTTSKESMETVIKRLLERR
jgi:hypothetical protein